MLCVIVNVWFEKNIFCVLIYLQRNFTYFSYALYNPATLSNLLKLYSFHKHLLLILLNYFQLKWHSAISLAILKYSFLCQSSLLHVLLHKPVALSCWNVKSSRVILGLYPLVVMFSFHSFFLLALSYNVQIDKTLNLSIPQRIDFHPKRMLERRSYSQLKNDGNKWSIQEQMR